MVVVVPRHRIDEPSDACGSELPKPEQIDTLLLDGPLGDTPDVVGLTPVVRKLRRTKREYLSAATGAAGPIPSGDAKVPKQRRCRGRRIGPTCCRARWTTYREQDSTSTASNNQLIY